MRLMNKKLAGLILGIVVAFAAAMPAFAEVCGYDPGIPGDKLVSGAYEYSEYTFVTGEPVLLKGTVEKPKLSSIFSANPMKMSYSFNVQNEDGSIAIQRSITYDLKLVKNEELGQISIERDIKSFDESITVPDGQYTLGKLNHFESRISDINSASIYASGNALFEKTFYLNGEMLKNDGVLTIRTEVRPIIQYENLYSKNESYVVSQEYKKIGKSGDVEFSGIVDTKLNSTAKTVFDYQYTDPQNISFRGSFFKYKNEENVLECHSNFYKGKSPDKKDDKEEKSDKAEDKKKKDDKNKDKEDAVRKPRKGVFRLSTTTVTDSEALYIPNIRDLGGHFAERPIMMLTAMGIFDDSRKYFIPNVSVSRHEFAKALYIALKGKLEEPSKTEVTKRLRPGVETPFADVSVNNDDYHYIEAYKKEGIVNGRHHYLKPNELITKAEAVTMMIRALGLEKVAPNPPYSTIFVDDAKIGEWAKDSFYMALEIGLLGGPDTSSVVNDSRGMYDYGSGVELYANPKEFVSRAEAAILLERLINHLNERMIPDYREHIIK